MPKKVMPSERMEQALSEKLTNDLLDLSGFLLETSAVYIQKSMEREREVFLQPRWAQRSPDAKGYANGAGPENVVRVLLEMDARIRGLEQHVEAGEQRIIELEDRLSTNSRNIRKPPSTDGFTRPQPKTLR